MNSRFSGLSESELSDVIESAQKALKEKQEGKRKEVLAQIKELGDSIGVAVEISEISARPRTGRRGGKVPVKYQNPNNLSQQWTGRGIKPKWLQGLVEQGRDIKEFEIRA